MGKEIALTDIIWKPHQAHELMKDERMEREDD